MKRWQPDAVLGMGGYVSGPGGIAAWLSGIPVVYTNKTRLQV